MMLLAYLFWTWSLLNAFFIIGALFGTWMSQSKVELNVKNHFQLFIFSLSFGTFFFSAKSSSLIVAGVALLISLAALVPLCSDMLVLYRVNPWSWKGQLIKVKQIIPYYNPRLYWLIVSLFFGITILLWQPLDDFLSWEILLCTLVIYYLGVGVLFKRTKRYNYFRQGLSEGAWSEFSATEPRYDFYSVIYFLSRGLLSWSYIKEIYPQLYETAPLEMKDKLVFIKKFHNNFPEFLATLKNNASQVYSGLNSEEKQTILRKLEEEFEAFDFLWGLLSKEEQSQEGFLWLKIQKEKNNRNLVEVEKISSALGESEDKDYLLQEISLLKRQKLQSLEFIWTSRDELIISEEDYQRSSPLDRLFVKKYKMDLYKIFNNCCVKSKSSEEIEIDHFFLPKSQGGSFLMQRKDGLWVVNAVILNKKYNGSKGVKKIEEFFSIEELMLINSKLKQLAIKINEDLLGMV